ncbi:glutamine amidotransferase [mine drainage metagenome]|uniref:Glutamine amidotransferase n=1 Tax=mine drainage metagenome TaxID=410659 RepID=A0A1J5SSK4_9ZZZZ
MKPIVIFRHALTEGPGYLATFLDEQKVPWQLIKIDEGEALPDSIEGYSGVALMGGPMSVNDDLPWITPLLGLIREAYALDVPLLGHCLGGQLISKALGGNVTKNPIKEIGWGELAVSSNDAAKRWFGELEVFNGFHWHGETFSLPENAVHLLASHFCQNQAYAIGKHLAFQCHIEMTEEMVQNWCKAGIDELLESASSPAVQQADVMQQDLPLHCFFLNKVAKQVYTQWVKGLAQ